MVMLIPKKVTNGRELIIVPRKDWENLQKIAKMKVFQLELEKGLKEALKEVKAGRLLGPFETVEEFKKAIHRHYL